MSLTFPPLCLTSKGEWREVEREWKGRTRGLEWRGRTGGLDWRGRRADSTMLPTRRSVND